MKPQRFELTGTIGGYRREDASAMPFTVIPERGNMQIPVALNQESDAVRKLFAAALEQFGDPQRLFGRSLILDEAFPNLVIHGLQGRADLASTAKLTVEIHRDALHRRVIIMLSLPDHTAPFDLDSLPDPTAPENLDQTTGRGVMLMRTIGNATIQQIPHPGGKTVVYAWEEEFDLPAPAAPASEAASESTSA